MSDYDEIDDQAGFLAPLMGQLNEMYPQPPLGPPPADIFCSVCGKKLEWYVGAMGMWCYTNILVLNKSDAFLTNNEGGFPEIHGPVRTEPVRYCSYACADKANPKPTTT